LRKFVVASNNRRRNLHTRDASTSNDRTKSRSIQYTKLRVILTVQRTIYTLSIYLKSHVLMRHLIQAHH
jgi:hypothetical protein